MTIARYLLQKHPELFGGLEEARTRVRYYTGKNGSSNITKNIGELIRDTPTDIPPTWRKKRDDYNLCAGLWLVLSDIHVPFHERKPIESAIKSGQIENVDGILINGDLHDCSSISYWGVSHRDFPRETELVIDFLDFLRSEFRGKKIVWKPGNHELRLPRLYITKVPELVEMPFLAMEAALDLDGRNIEFLDFYQVVMAGKLPIVHGHEVKSMSSLVNPARGLFLRAKGSAACSHCHRTSEHVETKLNGSVMTCWSFGCLCDLSPDYWPYGNSWNWGFALINVEKDGNYEVINKRIDNKTGKVY